MISAGQAKEMMKEKVSLLELQKDILEAIEMEHNYLVFDWNENEYEYSMSELCDILVAAGYGVSYSEYFNIEHIYRVEIYWGEGEE